MDYGKRVAEELERSVLDSVFGLSVDAADGERVTLRAGDATWDVSAPALLAGWRGTRRGWALEPRISWGMILSDITKAKEAV